MKIQGIKSQGNVSDVLLLTGNILSINGKDYDLDALLPPSVEEGADNTQFFIDNQCYIINGTKYIKIHVDNQDYFLFINNNYLLFFDVDMDGEIDIDELGNLIDHYNLNEEEKVGVRKDIINIHEEIDGPWNDLAKKVKKNKDKIEDKNKPNKNK